MLINLTCIGAIYSDPHCFFCSIQRFCKIRYISQKEELGRKYIYLEGKSLTAEGSATTVVKQWVE